MECLFSHWVGGHCIRWIVYFHDNLRQKEFGSESTLEVGQNQVGKSILSSTSGGVLEDAGRKPKQTHCETSPPRRPAPKKISYEGTGSPPDAGLPSHQTRSAPQL